MKNVPFIIERTFDASPESVWQALTDKDLMKQWYFDLDKFKPIVGFEFQFYGTGHKGEKYLHLCKVTEVTEFKKLVYSWSYKGYPGISFLRFEIFPEGTKTRLKLTHDGLESFPNNNPDFAKENFANGWTQLIGTSLKNFLEGKK